MAFKSHLEVKAAIDAGLATHERRVRAIIDGLNSVPYDVGGSVPAHAANAPATVAARKAIAEMLALKHPEFNAQGKRVALAAEVSLIAQSLKSDAARAYFHRVIILS